jgi:heat shock protein HtpX
MPPRPYVMEFGAPNAFATYLPDGSAAIVATRSLLTQLDRDELQAVVAHEVAHIRNGDVRFMTMVVFIAGIVPLLCRALVEGITSLDLDDGLVVVVVMLGAVVILWALSPLFALVLRVAISRKREYLADATAVELTRNPGALCSALARLGSTRQTRFAAGATATRHMYIVDPSCQGNCNRGTFFSTHPPIHNRIRAIHELMGTDPGRL